MTRWLERRFPGVFVRLAELRRIPQVGSGERVAGAPRSVLARAAAALSTWRDRARTRTALGRMNEWDLRDIGLSRSQLVWEMSKPFWRA